MQINIDISGSSPLDQDIKAKALKKIATLDTVTLERLYKLANSEKAIKKFNSSWTFVKNYVGV